jgi:PCRF domain
MDLHPHIERFRKRFGEVESLLSDPKVFDNPQAAQELSREYARLKDLVAAGGAYLKAVADLTENRELLKSEVAESELALMAKEEILTRPTDPFRPGPAKPDRFAQHHHRNPRGRGRFGICIVRRGFVSDVFALL